MSKYLTLSVFLLLYFALPGLNASAAPTELLSASQKEDIREAQHIEAKVILFDDGSLLATMKLVNAARVWGLCGITYFAIKNKQGEVLEINSVPETCIGEMGQGVNPIMREVSWEGKLTSSQFLKEASTIDVKCFDSSHDPIHVLGVKIQSLKDIFK